MKRSSFPLGRFVAACCLICLIVALSGCSRTRPRRWYEFWRPKNPPIYNQDVELFPAPPEVPPVDLQGPSALPGDDTSIPATDPVRMAPTAMVSELQTVHFEYDSYNLSPEEQERLRQNAQWIKSHPGITIQIEGHCDERGSSEYNLSLGQKRSDTVREFLAREGVDPQTLVTISYGEERPLPDSLGHDESSWSKNRRAQFLIY